MFDCNVQYDLGCELRAVEMIRGVLKYFPEMQRYSADECFRLWGVSVFSDLIYGRCGFFSW